MLSRLPHTRGMATDTDTAAASDRLVALARVRDLVTSGAARSVRVAAGLSTREVADAIGVTTVTVWRWEAGQRVPRGDAALAYLDLLDRLMTRGRR